MTESTKLERQLWSGFIRSWQRSPDRAAIKVAGEEVSYGKLAHGAMRLAATIQTKVPGGGVSLTAVFAYRSETAYAAILGTSMAGHGYVPLNRTFPLERTRLMLERSMCRSMVVDAGSEPQLEPLLAGMETPLLILCPDRSDVSQLS